jgi:hypothetical protein
LNYFIKGIDVKDSSSNVLQSSKLGKNINLNGGSFQNIQDAIDMANPGDTIYLNGRTYIGLSQITINKPINIIGARSADIMSATDSAIEPIQSSLNLFSYNVIVLY